MAGAKQVQLGISEYHHKRKYYRITANTNDFYTLVTLAHCVTHAFVSTKNRGVSKRKMCNSGRQAWTVYPQVFIRCTSADLASHNT